MTIFTVFFIRFDGSYWTADPLQWRIGPWDSSDGLFSASSQAPSLRPSCRASRAAGSSLLCFSVASARSSAAGSVPLSSTNRSVNSGAPGPGSFQSLVLLSSCGFGASSPRRRHSNHLAYLYSGEASSLTGPRCVSRITRRRQDGTGGHAECKPRIALFARVGEQL